MILKLLPNQSSRTDGKFEVGERHNAEVLRLIAASSICR